MHINLLLYHMIGNISEHHIFGANFCYRMSGRTPFFTIFQVRGMFLTWSYNHCLQEFMTFRCNGRKHVGNVCVLLYDISNSSNFHRRYYLRRWQNCHYIVYIDFAVVRFEIRFHKILKTKHTKIIHVWKYSTSTV